MSTDDKYTHCDDCAPEFQCWSDRYTHCRKRPVIDQLGDEIAKLRKAVAAATGLRGPAIDSHPAPAPTLEVRVECKGCGWAGRMSQAASRNGSASCPVCTRFVYTIGATS